jgi:transcriptional regulator with XRE-family HTH domain
VPGQDAIRRKLGAELAELRKRLGLSGRALAAALGWSQPKVSRIENGVHLAPLADIERWLDHCGADPATRHHVLALARAAADDSPVLPDVDALTVSIYQALMVPGLLQTPDYARNVLLTTGVAVEDTAAAAVAARVQRQGTLADGTQDVHALLTETALTWQPCPTAVLVEQLHRLRTLADWPNVTLGIISAAQQRLAPASASFTITRWPDGAADVSTETPAGDHVVTRQGDVVRYHEMFTRQQGHAVYGDEASDLLTRIAASLK